MTIKNVAIIGAKSRVGPAILKALIACDSFNVTVLNRASSKSTYPSSIRTVKVPDDLSVEALTTALAGQDALIITFPGTKSAESIRLAEACVKAGVGRLIPADFGSGDSADLHAQQLISYYAEKAKVRAYLEKLAIEHESFTWTSLICGHFFDYGLISGFLPFNIKERSAEIFDDGEVKWSASTLARIGEGVVAVLRKEDVTKNQILYIQSFCINQFDILEALQRQTGQDWGVHFLKSAPFIEEMKAKSDQGDEDALEKLVLAHGITTSNWEKKETFANDMLGLTTEDLEHVVKQAVEATFAGT